MHQLIDCCTAKHMLWANFSRADSCGLQARSLMGLPFAGFEAFHACHIVGHDKARARGHGLESRCLT